MRREHLFRTSREDAIALLERAPAVHFATTTPEGAPMLRTVHGVIVDDAIAFHAAPVGEKVLGLGRDVVIGAEEIVAQIPSYFVDPERACPATTFYRSAQVHGVLHEVTDSRQKARVLTALMKKFQPEGKHVPINEGDPMYTRAVEGIMVVSVSLERLDGKAKIGQNRKPEERAKLLTSMWRRGSATDPRAIDLVRATGVPTPPFLDSPAGTTLICEMQPEAADEAAVLLRDSYWNTGIRPARIADAHVGSTAWVGARDESGVLVASARAIADGAKFAWIYDVVVADGWRSRGLGRAMLRLLLDHPAVRGARRVLLGTKDAQSFYRGLGFIEESELPPKPYRSTTMVLARNTPTP